MLLPHEAAYVEFLQLRKVPLVEVSPSPSVKSTSGAQQGGVSSDQVLQALRREAETDREVMETRMDNMHKTILYRHILGRAP